MVEEGATHVRERTFTREDVRAFGDLSRDRQSIHTDPDEEGRLVVQGLLTATLPTEIGADLEVLATDMRFEFPRPVYTGDTVVCEWTTDRVRDDGDRYDLTASVTCSRDDDVVMHGAVEGVVWK